MRTIARVLVILAVLLAAGIGTAVAQQPLTREGATPPPAPPVLKLTIPGFSDGGPIAMKYTCQGAMASPALQWANVPKATVTFAVIMHGTDNHPAKASTDEMFWVIWNIPGNLSQLPEGVPANPQLTDGSMQSKGGRNVIGYRAPCPPPGSGPHHYVFELYALDQKLDVTPAAGREDVLKAMDGHVVGASAYVGVFQQ